MAGKQLYLDIIGVSVRLFKYLLTDYYDEFVFSVNEWVVRCLKVLPAGHTDVDAARHARTLQLQVLYIKHVLTDKMVELFNNGLDHLSHVVHTANTQQDADAETRRLIGEFVKFTARHSLHVDSAPTLSRFFTCRDCLDRMLAMNMINMAKDAFRVWKTTPRPQNEKRMTIVQNFFKHADAGFTLRVTALTFQLTGGVEAMLSENPKEGEPPPLVRLCKNEAARMLEARLRGIVASIAAGHDPDHDIGAAMGELYDERVIHSFLTAPEDELDIGCGLQLQRRAWEEGSEIAATRCDEELAMLNRPMFHLFDVEDRHAEVKKWESKRDDIELAARAMRSPRSNAAGDPRADAHRRAGARLAEPLRHSACWSSVLSVETA